MAAKRPERKESGEWAVHLRPFRKKQYWRKNRHSAKIEGKNHAKETLPQNR